MRGSLLTHLGALLVGGCVGVVVALSLSPGHATVEPLPLPVVPDVVVVKAEEEPVERTELQECTEQVETLRQQVVQQRWDCHRQVADAGGVPPIPWDDETQAEHHRAVLEEALAGCEIHEGVEIDCGERPCGVFTNREEVLGVVMTCADMTSSLERLSPGAPRLARQVGERGTVNAVFPAASPTLDPDELSARTTVRLRMAYELLQPVEE